jgi:hypothetical protein
VIKLTTSPTAKRIYQYADERLGLDSLAELVSARPEGNACAVFLGSSLTTN